MKCRIDKGNTTCRRCQRSGVPCVFVPRANAALSIDCLQVTDGRQLEFNRSTLRRLEAIEGCLGLSTPEDSGSTNATDDTDDFGEIAGQQGGSKDPTLRPLWQAIACLRKMRLGSSVDVAIWRKSILKHLWLTYAPGSLDACVKVMMGSSWLTW
jgi:hypothetical protein